MQHVIQPSANLNAGDLDCMTDLGLADGTIPDQNITGWPNVSFSGAPEYSSPSGARLNAASAWCVNASSFPEQDATLTIDLGSSRLISVFTVGNTILDHSIRDTPTFKRGFRVQPAPAEVHSRDYSSFAALEYSLDGDAWTLCCSMETVGVSHSVSRVAHTHRTV
ncbi:hypothetical protein FJT64_021816 [Amphibalanus amphitrite]|uniref:F5/8 type C domain-containing protein n=1 Tax=Amphibalanus amphitrite TaxID=1232801 RepID=A0A6A4WIX2_AMPAM|nr:hypothetical protein FJT64_021816 [Amphibalanus amphitrite]